MLFLRLSSLQFLLLLLFFHLLHRKLLLNLIELKSHGDVGVLNERQLTLQLLGLGKHRLLDQRPLFVKYHILEFEQEVTHEHDNHEQREDTSRRGLECVVASEVDGDWLSKLVLVLKRVIDLVEQLSKVTSPVVNFLLASLLCLLSNPRHNCTN